MLMGNMWVILNPHKLTHQPCLHRFSIITVAFFSIHEPILVTLSFIGRRSTFTHIQTILLELFSASSLVAQWILSSAENGVQPSRRLLRHEGHGEKERGKLPVRSHLSGQNRRPNFGPARRRYANNDSILTWVWFLFVNNLFVSLLLLVSVYVRHLICSYRLLLPGC